MVKLSGINTQFECVVYNKCPANVTQVKILYLKHSLNLHFYDLKSTCFSVPKGVEKRKQHVSLKLHSL